MMHVAGCSRHSRNCLHYVDWPDQPVGHRLRPHCCTSFLIELLDYTSHFMNSIGVICWLDLGSLLGAWRTGEFIPWDGDIDVSIFHDDVEKILSKTTSVLDDGYLIRYRLVGRDINDWVNCTERKRYQPEDQVEILRIQLNEINKLHVDIFTSINEQGTIHRINSRLGSKRDFPERFCNWGEVDLYGRKFPCPSPTGEYLELMYGTDYMVPKRMAPKWE